MDASTPAAPTGRRPSILVIYHYFAHYRLPVMRELVLRDTADFRFVADTKAHLESLPLVGPSAALGKGKVYSDLLVPVINHWFFGRFLWQEGLFGAIRKEKSADACIFLGNMYYLSTWVCGLYLRLTGRPVIFWGHGFTRSSGNFVVEAVRTVFYRIANAHFLYGHRAKQIMVAKGFKESNLLVVGNSLDWCEQREVHRRLLETSYSAPVAHCGGKQVRLILVGRLNIEKRVDLLIEAVAILKENNWKVGCEIVGAGALRSTLEQQARDLGVAQEVVFLGPCYEEEMLAKRFIEADICVVPGKVGLTSIHAMTYGIPVISHGHLDEQNPEVETIVEGETGELFEEGSARSLADAIVRWLSRDLPKKETAARCIRLIEAKFSPKSQADMIFRGIEFLMRRNR